MKIQEGQQPSSSLKQPVIDPLRNLQEYMLNNSFSNTSVSTINPRDTGDDVEISRVDDEESKGDVTQLQLDNEDHKREILMEFGGREISALSPENRANNNNISDDDEDSAIETRQDQDPNFNMRDLAIMHMAKKNLSFELEYIQIVCQSLGGINASNQFTEFSKKMQDDPLLALSSAEESKGVRFAEDQTPKKISKDEEAKQTKLRTFLESAYSSLNQMKKDVLKDENKLSREDLKKHLTNMACFLERTRLYLDSFIYPRDLFLNLIDVEIEETAIVDKKRQMHLTERLYTIVYKDFFTAYERAVLFHQKIQKFAGKEIEDHQQLLNNNRPSQVALDQDILEDERGSIQIGSGLEGEKLGKDAEEFRKHLSRKEGVEANQIKNTMNMLKGFNPQFATLTSIDEINDQEFTFYLKMKSVLSKNFEIQMALYYENSRPFSMTTIYEHGQSINVKQDQQCFYFVNIPMKAILLNNLALIVKIIEKKYSRNPSSSLSMSNQPNVSNCNKILRGYTILPISKLFWIQQLRVKQIYEIREAQIYKPTAGQLIEDKYATMIDKRLFKKQKDVALSQIFNLSYIYKMEPKMKDEQIKKRNAIIVHRVNFDSSMFLNKDDDQMNHMKQKVEKYRFNDLQLNLNNAVFTEAFAKKSPVIRIEVSLRDNYGISYDTVYKTITDSTFNFQQTYESLIYPLDPLEFGINEGFFVRIPTKSLDTLKKIYLIFQVQTLINQKDSKNNKIKASNFQNDIETLQFKTEMVAALPLYDASEKCILKNKKYTLELLQIDDFKKPIPHKYEQFRLNTQVSNLRPTNERLTVSLKLISNEFTHNTYINNLLLIKETNMHEYEVETILKELKKLKDTNDQILFHDKILDKLFQLMSNNNDNEISELIFETIILMIDLFQSRFVDYKDILENYIQKHFAQSKAYQALLQQILKTSEKIQAGLIENAQNEQKNAYVLMTLKYLGTILKIVRNSYLEAIQCQDLNNDSKFQMSEAESEITSNQQMNNGLNKQKFDVYKKSMIEEENEEDSDEEEKFNDDKLSNVRSSQLRKGAIRRTTYQAQAPTDINAPLQIIQQPGDLTKRQFGAKIQKALSNIFEGVHKDSMRTTLSLRAILYENITQIFENITDFMDDQFLHTILHYLYEEQALIGVPQTLNGPQFRDPKVDKPPQKKEVKPSGGGILKKSEDDTKANKITRRSEMQSVAGQVISLDMDFYTQENNVKALQDYNWINEEEITKIKIIAMGKLLSNGIFEKVQGDTNKIVMQFCNNIEKHHLKRQEMSLYVFFFLYQLFQYLKSVDDFSEIEDPNTTSKLKIFTKNSLDMRDFFAKILPEISNSLKTLLKDANIEDRVKEIKFPDDCLKPFGEKSSLILLSILNTLTLDKFQYFIFNEPKKLLAVVKNLKKLSAKMVFQEPISIYFEKKKIQVLRKTIMFIIQIFMSKDPQNIPSDYFTVISQCRLMIIYLWNKLAKINEDFKQTTRSRTLVKDQLKVYKGKMLEVFRAFWSKFGHLGQPWLSIKNSMTKQFISFIKISNDKAIKLYMEVISDTMSLEYQETQDVHHSSSSIFKAFYELSNIPGPNSVKFFEAFEKIMCEHNQIFQRDAVFQGIIRKRFQQMKSLSDAIINVNYSKTQMKENIFYRAYCMAQLIEVLWELKLFQIFLDNQGQYESLNKQLENNLEVAYTSLRFVESLEHQSEDDRVKIGQREIFARIQLNNLQKVQQFFVKAEFFEKAIEILNKQKDIAENMLFDYQMVSMLVKQQYKLYRQLAQDQDRHFAVYYKVGFFGQSFPNMLRNKEFIYRARKMTKYQDVKDKFTRFFSDALFIENNNYPDKSTTSGDKKCIQIRKVDPMTYVELKDFGFTEKTKDKEELEIGKKAKDLPIKQKAYYIENFKNQFYVQKMLEKNGDNELQRDRLIEIFKVKNKFPTVYNMQEIIKTKKIIRHAIDEAVRQVQNIIEQIETFRKVAISTEDFSDYETLTSQIRAALESPIQGGLERFINTFITEPNLRGNQRDKTLLLFQKIEECNQVINEGIQAIKSFTNQETMINKINGDYTNFKEKILKVRQYIDGRVL